MTVVDAAGFADDESEVAAGFAEAAAGSDEVVVLRLSLR